MSLQGRNIVVTGAAQGIGRAIGNLVLDLGGTVTAVDLNADGVQAFAAEAGAGCVLPLAGSVADAGFAQSVVEQAVGRFGAVHGLVNNAGITRPAMIEKMTLEQWQQVIDVHLTGSFNFLQAAGRHMLARSRGGDKTRWRDRQHLIRRRPPRHHRPDQLRRRQGRPAGPDDVRGARMGASTTSASIPSASAWSRRR